MKIVQLVPELNQGGVERGTVELSRELVRRGHDSIVISAGGRLVEQVNYDGGRHLTLDVCSKNPLTAPLRVHRLKRLLRHIRPDIVHARSRVPAWLCVFALKGLDIPFVTTVHGFNSVNAYSKVMTRGDRVICVSRAIRDYIKANYNTPEEKIRVVHRGVDLDEFCPDRLDTDFVQAFKVRHGLAGRYVAACVGRITPLKNFSAFIQAIKRCSATMPDIKGLIVGGARDDKRGHLAELEALVDSLGLGDTIIFAGSQQKMAEIYSLSDVVVACSRKPESFGRSLVEAMAMGRPVVSFAQGGPLDIIDDGRTGLFCRDGSPDALAEGIAKARNTAFADLRSYVKTYFSLDGMVENELDVYRQLEKQNP